MVSGIGPPVARCASILTSTEVPGRAERPVRSRGPAQSLAEHEGPPVAARRPVGVGGHPTNRAGRLPGATAKRDKQARR